MHFVKVETSDEDTRWINLDLVSRITIGDDESGVETMVILFADGDVGNSLTIRATDEVNQLAILELVRELNHCCNEPSP